MIKEESILVIGSRGSDLQKIRRDHPDANIVYCIEGYPSNAEFKLINDYCHLYNLLPDNFETYIYKESSKYIQQIIENQNLTNLFRVDNTDFLAQSRFSLGIVFYPIVKKIIMIDKALEKYTSIDLVVVSPEYQDTYTALKKGHLGKRIPSKLKSIKLRLLPILAILYKLVYLVILGKLHSKKEKELICNSHIMIGNIHEFNQFSTNLQKNIFETDYECLVLHPMHNYLKTKTLKKNYKTGFSFLPLDVFITTEDLWFCWKKYFLFLTGIKKQLNSNLSITHKGIELKQLFLNSMLEFYYYSYLVALKHYRISNRIVERVNEKQKVVFSYATTFSLNVINNVFKKNEFTTVTFNHGLIQTPYQIPSETNFCFSESKYDLQVMRLFSSNDTYKYVAPIFSFQNVSQEFKSNLKVLILSNVLYSRAPYKLTLDYIGFVYSIINQNTFNLKSTAVKPHPKEPKKILKNHLKLVDPKILLVDGDLYKILKNYSFVITVYSTVILECLKEGKPFLIYKTGFESNETFISVIPEELIFVDEIEFVEKFNHLMELDLSSLNEIYKGVFDNYYCR